jgi:hypothetical protein
VALVFVVAPWCSQGTNKVEGRTVSMERDEGRILADEGRILADEVRILNEQRVYYPECPKSGDSFRRPAVVETRRVYERIPEYREIKSRNLDRDRGAEYWLLMKRATDRFLKAVASTALADDFDIIAEPLAVEQGGRSIPNVTWRVLQFI